MLVCMLVLQRSIEVTGTPRAVASSSCNPPDMGAGMQTLDPLREQQAFLTMESSLKPQISLLVCYLTFYLHFSLEAFVYLLCSLKNYASFIFCTCSYFSGFFFCLFWFFEENLRITFSVFHPSFGSLSRAHSAVALSFLQGT